MFLGSVRYNIQYIKSAELTGKWKCKTMQLDMSQATDVVATQIWFFKHR